MTSSNSRRKIDIDYLKSILDYNPETGIFTWKVSKANCIKKGDIAGSKPNQGDYINISIDGTTYLAHRLAFLFMGYESMPDYVDHKDTDTLNNIWTNLREATATGNRCNTGVRIDNKLRIKGICVGRNSRGYFYLCQVTIHGKKTSAKFPYNSTNSEEVLVIAKEWVSNTREELHKDFTRHK